MGSQAPELPEPIPVLRAYVIGRKIWCAGLMLFTGRQQVRALCEALDKTTIRDSAVSVAFDGGPPTLLIESFRETARRERGRRDGPQKQNGRKVEALPAGSL